MNQETQLVSVPLKHIKDTRRVLWEAREYIEQAYTHLPQDWKLRRDVVARLNKAITYYDKKLAEQEPGRTTAS